MTAQTPVRVGIVGCGSVSSPYIQALLQLNIPRPRAQIVVGCDIDDARREEMREWWGVDEFTTVYQEVVNSSEVDLVMVLTSMPMHGVITRAALSAGKHVLVEKPMAMTLEEASEIVKLAASSPGYLICAPHVILSPTYQAMWRRIHDGDIGTVRSARGFYGWAGPDWGPWKYKPGGGAMFELGVYNVTTLTGLIGPAQRVMAMSGIAVPERVVEGIPVVAEIDDNAQLLLDFGEACYGVVTTGYTFQKYRCSGVEVYGSEGTIQMIGEDWAPRGYELWRNRDGSWQTFQDKCELAWEEWSWTAGIGHMIDCIERETPPLITPEHAYHALEIMLKSMESGRIGQAIPIESTFESARFETARELGDYSDEAYQHE